MHTLNRHDTCNTSIHTAMISLPNDLDLETVTIRICYCHGHGTYDANSVITTY
jgi:hypothetical protein